MWVRPLRRNLLYESARRLVFRRKGRRCWWCGETADTVDHVIPRSRGGSDALSNLVPACSRCNQDHGDLLPGEWAARLDQAGDPRRDRVASLARAAASGKEAG